MNAEMSKRVAALGVLLVAAEYLGLDQHQLLRSPAFEVKKGLGPNTEKEDVRMKGALELAAAEFK